MRKQNSTKRAWLASVLSLLLCVSMLVGTTFAWFTDTAKTGVNTIQSGNLDLVLEYWDGTNWTEVGEYTKLFKEGALWEPGYTEVAYIRVRNNGSLAFKYQLAVNAANEEKGTNVGGQEFALSQYIQFGVVESKTDIGKYATREDAWAAVAGETTTLNTYNSEGVLLPKNGEIEAGVAYLALVVYMPTTVGNEANHKHGTKAPSIDLGVTVTATQTPHENDSFGNDYDNILGENERRATSDAELAELLAGDLTGVDTIYLGAGTFNAFNLTTGNTLNFVGATDAEGKPATVISMPKAPTSFTTVTDSSMWNGFKGSVKNVSFKAANDSGLLLLYSDDVSVASDATFENCAFDNVGVKFSGSVDFTSCTFDGQNKAEKAIAYSVVPANGTAKFTGCTIKNYTQCGINIAESAGSLIINNSVLENCQAEGEYGIHVGQIDTVKITGSTLKCDVHYYESLIKTFECDNNQFADGFSASKE